MPQDKLDEVFCEDNSRAVEYLDVTEGFWHRLVREDKHYPDKLWFEERFNLTREEVARVAGYLHNWLTTGKLFE